MDRFDSLIAEFVPDDGSPFDRKTVVELMELAFRLGENYGLTKILSAAKATLKTRIRTSPAPQKTEG